MTKSRIKHFMIKSRFKHKTKEQTKGQTEHILLLSAFIPILVHILDEVARVHQQREPAELQLVPLTTKSTKSTKSRTS